MSAAEPRDNSASTNTVVAGPRKIIVSGVELLVENRCGQLDRAVEIAGSRALTGKFDIRHSSQRHDELFVHEHFARLGQKFQAG